MWLDILSFPGTPAADRAYRDIERWVFATYRPPFAMVRPEWSKGWAYTARGAWTNRTMIARTVPDAFRVGRNRRRRGMPRSRRSNGSTRTASSRARCCARCCAVHSQGAAAALAATEKDVSIGGAGLAAAAVELGLVDELRMFRYPVVVGGGTPFCRRSPKTFRWT